MASRATSSAVAAQLRSGKPGSSVEAVNARWSGSYTISNSASSRVI
jgi:hypothetical protein